jgi:mono/diheme cytochrome c family protein
MSARPKRAESACGPREPRVFESASVSSWGWGPTSVDKCRPSRWRPVSIALIGVALLSACRQDMHNQPKYRGLRASAFFADGSSARPLVEGTIARGTLQTDAAFFTGKNGTTEVTELPFPVDEKVLDRGEQRYNIYCTPCHDRTGSGRGMVVQRGYRQPPSFHIDRLRTVGIGHFFDVMTNGFGAMPDYRVQISPRDRWNIAAYIRALQLSQHAAAADVPGGDPAKLAPAPAAGHGREGR